MCNSLLSLLEVIEGGFGGADFRNAVSSVVNGVGLHQQWGIFCEMLGVDSRRPL